MWKEIDAYVKSCNMITPGDRVLLGLSGGADSILLARYLLTLRDQGIISLYAIHLNHMIRQEEAKRDQEFVRDFCINWEIPHKILREDVTQYSKDHKLSLEEAGRVVRYEKMEEYADEMKCNKIALAHHEDDLAETVIFRMVRGTGPSGLPGILPVYGNRIRPLLCVDKVTILGMLDNISQEYVEDSTNVQLDYSRNHIRHRIIPELRKMNPQTSRHIRNLSGQMEELNQFVGQQIDHLYVELVKEEKDCLSISIEKAKTLLPFARKELIRRMIFHLSGKQKDITAVHIAMVEDLMELGDGKRNNLPYHLLAIHEQGRLSLTKIDENKVREQNHKKSCHYISKKYLDENGVCEVGLEEGDHFHFEIIPHKPWENLKNDCAIYLDYDKIKDGISVRKREEGDYFVMDASKRRKSLKRYFIDQKIPAFLRDQISLIAEGNHVLWISTGRMSEEYKITESTKHILKVMMEVYHVRKN